MKYRKIVQLLDEAQRSIESAKQAIQNPRTMDLAILDLALALGFITDADRRVLRASKRLLPKKRKSTKVATER